MSTESWIRKVVCALHSGRADYELAAKIIIAAMADYRLNQKAVADHIGRSESWVSRLLQWHRAGCPDETVFGPEIAARRDKLRRRNSAVLMPTPEALGEERLFSDGSSNVLPGQGEATRLAFGALSCCSEFGKTMRSLSRETLLLAYRTEETAKRREVLLALDEALERTLVATQTARKEVEAALTELAPQTMLDDSTVLTRSTGLRFVGSPSAGSPEARCPPIAPEPRNLGSRSAHCAP